MIGAGDTNGAAVPEGRHRQRRSAVLERVADEIRHDPLDVQGVGIKGERLFDLNGAVVTREDRSDSLDYLAHVDELAGGLHRLGLQPSGLEKIVHKGVRG